VKVALISDIHSNLEALQAVLRDLPRVNHIVCAGDFVGLCVKPTKTLRVLKRRKLLSVRGDHDHAVISGDFKSLRSPASEIAEWTRKRLGTRELKILESLPMRLELKLNGFRISVVHGSWKNPLKGRMRPAATEELAESVKDLDADVLIVGHTHIPFQRMILGKFLINPGSVGQPRDRDPRASYALLDLKREPRVIFRRVEYDVEKARKSIVRAGFPEEFSARLLFGW